MDRNDACVLISVMEGDFSVNPQIDTPRKLARERGVYAAAQTSLALNIMRLIT